MATEKFQSGDVVQLKSGGPKMTVSISDTDFTHLYFYNEDTHQFAQSLKLPTVVQKKAGES